MSEATGVTIAMPCQKGCGAPVLVSAAQAELLRGLPAAGRFQHEHCEGENETLSEPLRTYEVTVEVRESEGEVVTRLTATAEAVTFADACPALGEQMSATWRRIVEAAAIADSAP